MEYRSLGRTGVQVIVPGLGTMNFGSRNTEAETTELVNLAVGEGINFIDTANRYGDAKETPDLPFYL